MKLTENKRQLVKNKVIHYCKKIGCEIPNWLFLTKSEWQEWADYRKEITGIKRYRNSANYLGIASKTSKVIAIFVKNARNVKDLDNTIRHEVIHLAKSYNHNSKQFMKWQKWLIKKEKKI